MVPTEVAFGLLITAGESCGEVAVISLSLPEIRSSNWFQATFQQIFSAMPQVSLDKLWK
jgi:hypothetical protein